MSARRSDGGHLRAVFLWLRGQAWRLGTGVWWLCGLRIPVNWVAGGGLCVAFLGSLLFPTINYPRPAARRAACQSNLKQLGMAISMYVEDHDGRLPDLPPGPPGPPDLRPLLSKHLTNPGIWLCPEHGLDNDAARHGVSYGYNHLGLAGNGTGLRVSEIATSKDLLVLVDSGGPRAVPHGLRPGTPPEYRHEGRANVLWLDGHVKSLSPADVEARAGAAGALRDFPHWSPQPKHSIR
ncbi:MAG: DUF1559 domain-containing protein [Armatimonadota bacterium]